MANHRESGDQRRGLLLYRKKEEVRTGCFEGKSTGAKQELWVMMVFHWLSSSIFVLAELVAGQGGKVGLFPWGVQLTKSGSV